MKPLVQQSLHKADLSGVLRDLDLWRAAREGIRAARRRGASVLVSVCGEANPELDPCAVVFAARRGDEQWFCLEQPDRGGWALGALGSLATLEASGPDRFLEVGRRWDRLAADAIQLGDTGPPGGGLIAVGGFAFAPNGSSSSLWTGFAAASLTIPVLSVTRLDGRLWVTVNALVSPSVGLDSLHASLHDGASRLSPTSLPLFDPSPAGAAIVSSPLAPAHFEAAVARATERIRAGSMQKIVLAREVSVRAPVAHDPGAVFGVLREAYRTSFVFAVGRGDATFVGATPELLVRREGQRATTVALAGSTRRSADPAVDDHLGEALLRSEKDREENAIVARQIVQALRPLSVWVAAAPEPTVVKVANIQHLACPIRAQLAEPLGAVQLAARLHPTPAVGAEPRDALSLIPALEGLDRGWYAGPVGWTDANGDGEFCVALRSALLRGRDAACFAGCGIVADSDPAAELAESELKLGVMLPALAV